jgi:aminopeptidase YwaD
MIYKQERIFKSIALALILNVLVSCAPDKVDLQSALQSDIEYLASDELQGRMTGEAGERLAASYIAMRFKKIGLTPLPNKTDYYSDFDFTATPILGENNELKINDLKLLLGEDFYPASYSASGKANGKLVNVGFGITDESLNYNDFSDNIEPGSVFLLNISSPDGIHPHSKYLKHHDVLTRIEDALKYSPVAFVLHTNDQYADIPSPEMKRSGQLLSVPILFTTKPEQFSAESTIDLSVDIVRKDKTGRNVLAYLDNNAEKTILIGGHYDHLGFGEEHGSLHRGEKAVHNGADDNASGIAAIIALADWAKTEGPKSCNYIFSAFSGEELGLLGSKSLVQDSVINLSNISYMLNFDMVGRLDTTKNTLILSGTGTSPQWSFLDSARYDFVKIKLSESGIGPSDHTSFYLKEIPVLAFFSGTHPDYHKPTDDVEYINYNGMIKIIDVAKDVIMQTANLPKLEFTKTKDDANGNVPRFKVTLGVVPDYAFSGKGMRIDGVSQGKPAELGGLQAGDIVTKLGELPVNDMTSYMKALGYFAKGDSTTIIIQRNAEELTKTIHF